MNYRVVPIAPELVADVRQSMLSPQYRGLAANISIANGYGPCRSCLRVFEQGSDRRIYFTYNSFGDRSSLPDPGPVFIHESKCLSFEGTGFPSDILKLPVLLEAFGDESRLVSRLAMDRDRVDVQITELFADPCVRFVNIRNQEAGCYIARMERS